MISVVRVEPENEGEVDCAYRLQQLIQSAWPDLGRDDEVRIFVGLRAYREIDVVVTMDLAEPRIVPGRTLRGGPADPFLLQSACFALEIKQGDVSTFSCQGAGVFERGKPTSVNKQVEDEIVGLRRWLGRYPSLEPVVIGGIVWLPNVSEDELRDAEDRVVGANATWQQMLHGCVVQLPAIAGRKDERYRETIGFIGRKLAERRVPSQRDARRANAITNAALNAGILENAKAALDKRQLSLRGRAGSGKSTSLALLAQHVCEVRGERVLVLTYNHALCAELDALLRSLCGDGPIDRGEVVVVPLAEHLAGAYQWLFGDLPRSDDGIDYKAFDRAIESATQSPEARERLRELAADLRGAAPEVFEFRYVMIDEAQDVYDAERDFLRCLHADATFVLGDGVDQFVRRGERCDWNTGIASQHRTTLELQRSLRMAGNIATFLNEVAIAAGAENWQMQSHPGALGGRILLCDDGVATDAAFFASLLDDLWAQHATPSDMLISVWYGLVERPSRDSFIARDLRAWGYEVWDAVNPAVRDRQSPDGAIRIVQYESARGLEGWCTVLLELDQFYAHRLEHPNVKGCESLAQRERLARLWMLMAMARAAQTLVITVKDWDSAVGRWLLEAAGQMPKGTVERVCHTVGNPVA